MVAARNLRRLKSGLPAAFVAGGLAAIAYFDLPTAAPFNDEWIYRWDVTELALGHGFRAAPTQSASAIVQVAWAWLVSFGHADPRFMRLSILPFLLLIGGCLDRLAREGGASQFWSGVCAAAFVCNPLVLTLATGFMSDLPYVALMLVAIVGMRTWLVSQRGGVLVVVGTVFACLQRQLGVTVPIAFIVTLLIDPHRRHLLRGQWPMMSLLVGATFLALFVPNLMHMGLGSDQVFARDASTTITAHVVSAAVFFGPVLGLIGAPFLPALSVSLLPKRRTAINVVMLALIVVELAALTTFRVLPGNIVEQNGFAPSLAGAKVGAFPPGAFDALQFVAVTTCVTVAIAGVKSLRKRSISAPARFLVIVAASQLVPLFVIGQTVFDRYYLPAIAPILPLLAVASTRSRAPSPAALTALLVTAMGLLMFVVGQQDYVAWQAARDTAARLAYAEAPPDRVQAGYEENAVHIVLPLFEAVAAGRHRPVSNADYRRLALAPDQTWVRLEYSGPYDQMQGVGYSGFVRGKIILVRPGLTGSLLSASSRSTARPA